MDRRADRHQAALHREDGERRPTSRPMASRAAMERAGVHPGEARHHRARHGVPGSAAARRPPSTSRPRIGASRAAAFDIGAACSGFIYSATDRREHDRHGQRGHGARRRRREAQRDHRLDRSVDVRAVRRRRGRRGAQAVQAAARAFSRRSCAATDRSAICSAARRAARRIRSAKRCSPIARSTSR